MYANAYHKHNNMEEINEVLNRMTLLDEAEETLEKAQKNFAKKFMEKKNCDVFLKRHGLDTNYKSIKDDIVRFEIEDCSFLKMAMLGL